MTVSNKMAYAACEQSTIGQRPVWGTNALGAVGEHGAAQPWHTRSHGVARGCGVGLAQGAE